MIGLGLRWEDVARFALEGYFTKNIRMLMELRDGVAGEV